MEILYVVGMIAVFVLCLALFSTARKILRSSSLSNAQFGASRMYDVESPDDEISEELDSTKTEHPGLKAIFRRSNAAKNNFALMDDIDGMEFDQTESLIDEPAIVEPVFQPIAESATFEPAMFKSVPAESAAPEVFIPETILAQSFEAETTSTTATMEDATTEEESVMSAYMPPAIPSWAEKLADEDDADQLPANNFVQFRNPSLRKYNYALECLLLGVSAWFLFQTQRSTLKYRLAQTAGDRVA